MTGWCATGTVMSSTASAPVSAMSAVRSVATGTDGSPATAAPARAASRSRSTMPTSWTSGSAATVASQARPIPPAPTWTTRSGVTPVPLRFRLRVLDGRVVERAAVVLPVEVLAEVVPAQRRDLPLAFRPCPLGGVRDHPADVRVVVHGEVLVAGGEVEDLPEAATVRHPAPEHLATGEAGDEHELVGCGDVEVLAVHLLLGDDDRVRDPAGDGVLRVHGPDEFLVVLAPPPEGAGGAHQLPEDLRPVAGVQDHEPHPGEHVLVHAVHDGVVDVLVGGVPPPGQDVGLGEDLVGEAVLGLLHGRGADDGVRQVLADAVGDRAVHAVRVAVCHVLLDLLVDVLAPDGDAERGAGHGVPFWLWCVVASVRVRHLTAPPSAPAEMYFWAKTSRTAAGSDARTEVAMTGPSR